MKTIRAQITDEVLKFVQGLLVKTKDINESPAPEAIYVEMWTRSRHRLPPGDVIAKWRITRKDVAVLPIESPRPAHVSRGVGYYRIGWAEFSIFDENRFVEIGFKFGPGCSSGDIYQVICNSTQNVTLEKLKPAWTLG